MTFLQTLSTLGQYGFFFTVLRFTLSSSCTYSTHSVEQRNHAYTIYKFATNISQQFYRDGGLWPIFMSILAHRGLRGFC